MDMWLCRDPRNMAGASRRDLFNLASCLEQTLCSKEPFPVLYCSTFHEVFGVLNKENASPN